MVMKMVGAGDGGDIHEGKKKGGKKGLFLL
jgi:hypothetical protein